MVRVQSQAMQVRSSVSDPLHAPRGQIAQRSQEKQTPPGGQEVRAPSSRYPFEASSGKPGYRSASGRYQPSQRYQITGYDRPFAHPFEHSPLNPVQEYRVPGEKGKFHRSYLPNTSVGSREKNEEAPQSLAYSAAISMTQSTERIGQDLLHTPEDYLAQHVRQDSELSAVSYSALPKMPEPRIMGMSESHYPGMYDSLNSSEQAAYNRESQADSLGQGIVQSVAKGSRSAVHTYAGAFRYRQKQRAKLRKKFQEDLGAGSPGIRASGAASMAGVTASSAEALEKRVIDQATHHRMAKELAADYIRGIEDPYDDNLAMRGVMAGKNTVVKTYATTKYVHRVSHGISKAAHTTGRVASSIIQHAKSLFSSMAGWAAKAAPALPVIAVIVAILIVISAISSIVPTVSLKTDLVTLTKLYAYCTELDAKFSESVSEQLNRTGFNRIDFYENGAKSTGNHIWSVETDLDMLLAYYDAMFEDYSSARHFQSAKEYSKNLWEQLYTLSTSTHTERQTTHHSDGSTGHRTIYVLDIYVDTTSLSQFAASNAKPEGSKGETYRNVFDTPFGYLTDAQQDTYDALAEIGTFTALEEITNPFTAPDSDEETSWTVGRRYGYYLNMLTGEYHPQFNEGLYLNAPSPSGSAVYAGISGQATVQDGVVTIKSGTRKVTYGNLDAIAVSSGATVKSGTKLGNVGSNSPISTSALYMEYEYGGKEINPRFVVGGCSSSFSSVGSGDIVAVALSQVGTLETPVNQISYNDRYYGRHVAGSDYPWCAVFVSWCADQCGYIDAGIIPKQAGCDEVRSWFRARGQYHLRNSSYRPKAGDIIVFGSAADATHVGIVVSADDTRVYTVEGNTSKGGGLNPNGGGVWTKSYALTSTYIQGYCSPAYPTTGNDAGAPPQGAQKLGNFKITHYCPGSCCNDQWANVTATGAVPTPGVTIAVDPKVIPLNSKVYIQGYGTLRAQDTGGAIKGNRIDVLVATHAEANRLGVVYRDVYIVP